MDILTLYPELRSCLTDKDVVDIKTTVGRVDLRTFVAQMMSYNPWWMRMLYGVRPLLVRLLGLVEHEPTGDVPVLRPEDVSFTPGEVVLVFIVDQVREDHYWIVKSPPDKHLTAWLGVVAEDLGDGRRRFQVLTTVDYLHWTGPVYYNLIRPFHHLVVWGMMKAAVAE